MAKPDAVFLAGRTTLYDKHRYSVAVRSADRLRCDAQTGILAGLSRGRGHQQEDNRNRLFKSVKLGSLTLANRMAPLTRNPADSHGVHNDLAVTYYIRRESSPRRTQTKSVLVNKGAWRYDP